ncbi:hypothetical protein IGI04_018717 [Brassica rapa subsp. trilocularis]|uniref:Uncharacterized protein n=1 Tax=Brassica rapa subsp. trilocularis TaxID=1813537 RepID=A0ABQ7MDS9_BRACM|nr:hypothetical protein IGI04_018717 [Brassica rapa subsp. trilocularis]
MRQRITLKKSDPGNFLISCLIGGIDYPSALCDTCSSVSIRPKVMAYHLVCYSDPGDEIESDIGASIDTQPELSLDGRFEVMIDRALGAPIDSDYANEIDDFTERSINSWENDYYQPSFTIHTATSSKKKICVIQRDEYGVYRDEDGNTHALDGRIINVSKEDIENLLEMVDKSGGKYSSS